MIENALFTKGIFVLDIINGAARREGEGRGREEGWQRERCEELARYIVASGDTVRGAAQRFGISKSTVHKEVTERLRGVDRALYEETRAVLDRNKAERHLRGGEATRVRFAVMRGERDDIPEMD